MTVSDATIYKVRHDLWEEAQSNNTYTIRGRINLDNFEIDGPHTATDLEDVTCLSLAKHQREKGELSKPFRTGR